MTMLWGCSQKEEIKEEYYFSVRSVDEISDECQYYFLDSKYLDSNMVVNVNEFLYHRTF